MSILDFDGAEPMALIKRAKDFSETGSMYVKASKVLATAAVLMGAPLEDVALRTGISTGAIKRPVAIVNNGDSKTPKPAARTAAKVSAAFHALDFPALLGDSNDARYNAVIAAANFWDKFLSDQSEQKTPKSKTSDTYSAEELAEIAGKLTRSDFVTVIHSVIVAHDDDRAVWIAAVDDALETVQATLAEQAATAEAA